jgi:hypothetical protein
MDALQLISGVCLLVYLPLQEASLGENTFSCHGREVKVELRLLNSEMWVGMTGTVVRVWQY